MSCRSTSPFVLGSVTGGRLRASLFCLELREDPMRHVYLICYDVGEPKRLRRVYKCLQGAGESLQYSVFRCELSPEERQGLIERLWGLMNLREDRLLVANLGVSEGRGAENLQYWGVPRELPDSTRPLVL